MHNLDLKMEKWGTDSVRLNISELPLIQITQAYHPSILAKCDRKFVNRGFDYDEQHMKLPTFGIAYFKHWPETVGMVQLCQSSYNFNRTAMNYQARRN